MEWLGSWLTGVTAAAVLCALAESLMPEGPVRRVGKLALGLVMLAALLRPLAGLEGVDLGDWLEEYRSEQAAQTQELEQERDQALEPIIAQSFAAYIVDKAEELGAACTAQVRCQAGENGVLFPWEAVVEGTFTPEQGEELSRLLEEELGIPPERQRLETKEE